MRRFEFSEGSSNKFWAIRLDGVSYTVNYGKTGTAGQTQTKTFATPEVAQKEHDKLVAEKLKKGYHEVGASSVSAPPVAKAPAKPKAVTPVTPAPAPETPSVESEPAKPATASESPKAPEPAIAAALKSPEAPNPAVAPASEALKAPEPTIAAAPKSPEKPEPEVAEAPKPPEPAVAKAPKAPEPNISWEAPAPEASLWSSLKTVLKNFIAPKPEAAPPALVAAPAPSPQPLAFTPKDPKKYDGSAWKQGEAGEPEFPEDFEILKKAVLQVTDIKTNKNKYYAIELHKAGDEAYRVFTHYGRTDDLDTNPRAGQRECRYVLGLRAAEHEYQRIYSQKTGSGKGYKEIALASSRIGSQKAIGTSSGNIDGKTLEKLKGEGENKPKRPTYELPPAEVQDLMRYIYSEATDALTATVNAKITAKGIETPLGILTIGQIEKGEQILNSLYAEFQKGASREALETYSGEFYSAIPHRLGRTKAAISEMVIASLHDFEQKQETLQLMKDMLQVNGDGGNVLFNEEIGQQYKALNCSIVPVVGADMTKWAEYVVKSQVKSHNVKVKRIFAVRRAGEFERFREDIPNKRMLFHGSRIKNWVGLLSRGILLPKIVVSMGVKRTDPGWLGNGIYFGDAACTAAFYTTPGKRNTRFMAIAGVALGKVKDYTKITYGLESPPDGYQSCHGVPKRKSPGSQFDDDEYVVYDLRQQRLEYLVEFSA